MVLSGGLGFPRLLAPRLLEWPFLQAAWGSDHLSSESHCVASAVLGGQVGQNFASTLSVCERGRRDQVSLQRSTINHQLILLREAGDGRASRTLPPFVLWCLLGWRHPVSAKKLQNSWGMVVPPAPHLCPQSKLTSDLLSLRPPESEAKQQVQLAGCHPPELCVPGLGLGRWELY